MDNEQERSLSWLAGILDGEGSITFQTTFRSDGKLSVSPFVCVSNSDEGIIEEVKALFGALIANRKTGTVHCFAAKPYNRPSSFASDKTCYTIRVNGTATKPILEAVLPYLKSVKRKHAQTLLTYLESRANGLLLRGQRGRVVRTGYTNAEIDLVVSTRTHKLAKSSETLRSALNIVG